jgi:hypothetical protein
MRWCEEPILVLCARATIGCGDIDLRNSSGRNRCGLADASHALRRQALNYCYWALVCIRGHNLKVYCNVYLKLWSGFLINLSIFLSSTSCHCRFVQLAALADTKEELTCQRLSPAGRWRWLPRPSFERRLTADAAAASLATYRLVVLSSWLGVAWATGMVVYWPCL